MSSQPFHEPSPAVITIFTGGLFPASHAKRIHGGIESAQASERQERLGATGPGSIPQSLHVLRETRGNTQGQGKYWESHKVLVRLLGHFFKMFLFLEIMWFWHWFWRHTKWISSRRCDESDVERQHFSFPWSRLFTQFTFWEVEGPEFWPCSVWVQSDLIILNLGEWFG